MAASLLPMTSSTSKLRRGVILAIVGESGCGKSTFARIVAGLDTPTAGRISFGGKLLAEAGKRQP